MRRQRLPLRGVVIVILLFAFLSLIDRPPTAQGIGVPVYVTTANDTENGGGDGCSLREAIKAVNANGVYNECDAVNTPGTDKIYFDSSVTNINIGSALPTITRTVIINGAIPNGRVALRFTGPANTSINGLDFTSTAPNSSVSNVAIGGFTSAGIQVDATGFTVLSSLLGLDGYPNRQAGIIVNAANARIGGTNNKPAGQFSCAGDCNAISYNTYTGVYLSAGATNAQVIGNFIGVDEYGTQGAGDGFEGIHVNATGAVIGGDTPEEGNVIADNDTGIYADQNGNADNIVIQGNRIGTDVTGTKALANNYSGIYLRNADNAQILGNLISGNTSHGMDLGKSDNLQILNNKIGTRADGTTALPNGDSGIYFDSGTAGAKVGGTAAGEPNTIAYNGQNGIWVTGNVAPLATTGVEMRGNSIHDNYYPGIAVTAANNGIVPPVITNAWPAGATGTACANCTVDVYSDDAEEGKEYEGATTADGSGNWSFSGAIAGDNATAIATDAQHDSSAFSQPMALGQAPTPTPSPSPTPSPTRSPTLTPSATPASTATATATPTATPASGLTQGDVDCDGDIDEEDFLFVLGYVAGVNDGKTPGTCPDVGGAAPAGVVSNKWGDFNCDNHVTAYDALQLIAWPDIEIPHSNCKDIGQAI
jgi:CSLREA domain-containing protein